MSDQKPPCERCGGPWTVVGETLCLHCRFATAEVPGSKSCKACLGTGRCGFVRCSCTYPMAPAHQSREAPIVELDDGSRWIYMDGEWQRLTWWARITRGPFR